MATIENKLYTENYYNNRGKIIKSFDAIISLVMSIVNPRSVVDIGCAVGALLACFKEKGVSEILGVDGFWVKEEQLLIAKNEFMRHDLNGILKLSRKYDLAVSTEVAEHIFESNADYFVKNLVNASDVVLFSAAVPGQGGTNHVNEQWPQYWIEKFGRYDYLVFDCIRGSIWNNQDIEFWYKQNLFLFCKKDSVSRLNLPDTDSPKYNIIHPQQYEQKLLHLFGLFKQLYEANNYDLIIQLSFLRSYDYSVNLFLGLVYFDKQDHKNCIECLEKFLEISGLNNPSLFDTAIYVLGVSYLKMGNHKQAKKHLKKCVDENNQYKNDSLNLLRHCK